MFAMIVLAMTASVEVNAQHLQVEIDPDTHRVAGTSTMSVLRGGTLAYQLHPAAEVTRVQIDGRVVAFDTPGSIPNVPTGGEVILHWSGVHQEDVAAGERVGQIHNFSVNAHVGTDGIFLSDGSRWYPQPLDAEGRPQLRGISIDITPIEGWTLVASGDPACPVDEPCWSWATPRPVDGMAVVGNLHHVASRTVQTPHGAVDVAVHVSAANEDKVEWYLDASEQYLDLYTPLLGPYPFDRFTVVENFFSSGFAFPGFTVLGPRVVGMAPRSLKPGYLDHELLHAWWGNGVYVDPDDGNWCEAITSYCTNYGRRALEDGDMAARTYRRGLLNKVSLDPTLDDGPVGAFGSAARSESGPNRFVGYDKGAFVFMMLEDLLDEGTGPPAHADSRIWPMLRRLATTHMGKRIGWDAIQSEAEAVFPDRPDGWLDSFFDIWVRQHVVPITSPTLQAPEPQSIERVANGDGTQVQIDPDCRYYRLLPLDQTSPTIAGTLGAGVTIEIDEQLPVGQDVTGWMAETDPGDSLLLVGRGAIIRHADRIARTTDPIQIDGDAFIVDGVRWDQASQSCMHTMHDPDTPGRYITVFHSNGADGWNRLRLIWYYGKDTTVVWDGGETVLRRAYEPDAWMPATAIVVPESLTSDHRPVVAELLLIGN